MSVPFAGKDERMTNQLGVSGQQTHVLLPRLDQQRCVERVLVTEWLCQFGGGMDGCQWQQRPPIALANATTVAGATGPLRRPEIGKPRPVSRGSQTETAENTSGALVASICPRSTSVSASGSSAAPMALCVSSSSLNVQGRARVG